MAKGSVDMQNRTILSIVSKLKLLDLDKLELVDEAANNCIAVQTLENISKKNITKNKRVKRV
ncbi:Uncharacterised protein [uncultured Clostridium sp.]|nr:Uncharacterised protein [uncultured Clostridium sp.]